MPAVRRGFEKWLQKVSQERSEIEATARYRVLAADSGNRQRMPSFRFAADSSLESDGFEPSVPRGDGIFEAAPFELLGTAPL